MILRRRVTVALWSSRESPKWTYDRRHDPVTHHGSGTGTRCARCAGQGPTGRGSHHRAEQFACSSSEIGKTIGRTQPLRVFLCHSSSDKPQVRDLYRRLLEDNTDPWLDEEKLLVGQDWDLEIRKAVKDSHIVVVCLSASVSRPGYLQKEIGYALDVADEQPEGSIFIIPLKLTECDVPSRLSRWHWINFWSDGAYDKLIRSIRERERALGLSREL